MSHTEIRINLAVIIFCVLFFSIGSFAVASESNSNIAVSQNLPENGVTLKVNDTQFQLTQNYIEKIALSKESLIYNPEYKSEIENTNICPFGQESICDLFSFTKINNHVQKISRVTVDKKMLTELVDNLAKEFNKDPENAKFQATDGKISVFSPSTDGIEINKEKSIQMLTDYFQNGFPTKEIELPYDITKPELSTDSVNNLGINSLIGEGKSNFAGSPKNRVFNINVAIKKFDGVLICKNIRRS